MTPERRAAIERMIAIGDLDVLGREVARELLEAIDDAEIKLRVVIEQSDEMVHQGVCYAETLVRGTGEVDPGDATAQSFVAAFEEATRRAYGIGYAAGVLKGLHGPTVAFYQMDATPPRPRPEAAPGPKRPLNEIIRELRFARGMPLTQELNDTWIEATEAYKRESPKRENETDARYHERCCDQVARMVNGCR